VDAIRNAIAIAQRLISTAITTLFTAMAVIGRMEGATASGNFAAGSAEDARTKSLPKTCRERYIRAIMTAPMLRMALVMPSTCPRRTFLTSPENDVEATANHRENAGHSRKLMVWPRLKAGCSATPVAAP